MNRVEKRERTRLPPNPPFSLHEKQFPLTEITFPLFSFSTTNFLTTTIMTYTQRAGITAAAGTRLALFLFLASYFYLVLIPIKVRLVPIFIVILRHYLSQLLLPLGNFRACCQP